MGRTHVKRAVQGQAMVELALGLLVFVTVLIFCIHFAEVGYLSVKVTEAQHSALFDATGHELHRWPGNTKPAKDAVSRAGNDARARYADFDSRSGSSGGSSLSQVFTRAQSFNVTCQLGKGPGYTQDVVHAGAYANNGGMNCQASAQLSPFGIATSFLDDGDGRLFDTRHYVPSTIPLCGLGRGTCQARLTMMLDDWGLTGDKESKNCEMKMDSPGCANKPFYDMAKRVFMNNGAAQGVAGSMFALKIVGMTAINENQFWLSAQGEEKGFVQRISSEGTKRFPTTPGSTAEYKTSYEQRGNCFLGVCPKS